MPSISVFGFLRKVGRFWVSGKESHDLDASPAAPESSLKGRGQTQDGSATPGLACMGMIRSKSVDKKKLAHESSLTKQVKGQSSERKPAFRMPGVVRGRGRNKVQALPAAESMAAPPRSGGTMAAIGAIRMNSVAAPPRRVSNEVSLWKRRTQAEPPRLHID